MREIQSVYSGTGSIEQKQGLASFIGIRQIERTLKPRSVGVRIDDNRVINV